MNLIRFLVVFALTVSASSSMLVAQQLGGTNVAVLGKNSEHLGAVVAEIFPGRRIVDLGAGDFKGLPLNVRNRIAIAAANDLLTHTTNGLWISNETVDVLSYKPYVHDTPNESAVRHLDWTNHLAITLLRDLSNENLFNAPEVIPHLIQMLDYPGKRESISSMAAQVLRQLTGRDWDANGWRVKGPYHHQYIAWWRNWWEKNHDKHPVFDDELKMRIKSRIKELQMQLPAEAKGLYEMRYLANDYNIHPSDAYGGYIADRMVDSSMLSEGIIRTGPDGQVRTAGPDDFIFLRILAKFQTPPPRPRAIEVPKRWQPLLKEVHREVIPGTDVEITVSAASKDAKFMRAMSKAFER